VFREVKRMKEARGCEGVGLKVRGGAEEGGRRMKGFGIWGLGVLK